MNSAATQSAHAANYLQGRVDTVIELAMADAPGHMLENAIAEVLHEIGNCVADGDVSDAFANNLRVELDSVS